jgi:hypothetical protein
MSGSRVRLSTLTVLRACMLAADPMARATINMLHGISAAHAKQIAKTAMTSAIQVKAPHG